MIHTPLKSFSIAERCHGYRVVVPTTQMRWQQTSSYSHDTVIVQHSYIISIIDCTALLKISLEQNAVRFSCSSFLCHPTCTQTKEVMEELCFIGTLVAHPATGEKRLECIYFDDQDCVLFLYTVAQYVLGHPYIRHSIRGVDLIRVNGWGQQSVCQMRNYCDLLAGMPVMWDSRSFLAMQIWMFSGSVDYSRFQGSPCPVDQWIIQGWNLFTLSILLYHDGHICTKGGHTYHIQVVTPKWSRIMLVWSATDIALFSCWVLQCKWYPLWR